MIETSIKHHLKGYSNIPAIQHCIPRGENASTMTIEYRGETHRKTSILVTEYMDLYYIKSLDLGGQVDIVEVADKIIQEFSNFTWTLSLAYIPIPLIHEYEQKEWKKIGEGGIWVKPYAKINGEIPNDIQRYINCRAAIDLTLFSEEYLERQEFIRLVLGEVIVELGEEKKGLEKIPSLRGLIELFIHKNGVATLTLTFMIHDLKMTSTDVLKLRYVLEVEGVEIKLPRKPYITWILLKSGKIAETQAAKRSGTPYVKVKMKIWELVDAYSTYIKYIVAKMRGYEPSNLVELESLLRNPWDTMYVALFTEVLKGSKKIIEILKDYSLQIYAMLHGTRRIASTEAIRRTIKKSFYYIPAQNIGETLSKPLSRVNISRVTIVITDTNTHIVAISRKYLGPSDIGLRLRLRHLVVLELINHARQSLRVFEYLFIHRQLRNLNELVKLREEYSHVIDLIENHYFIVDRDMREFFTHAVKALEINRLIASVERKLESLNYIIMTRYQDKINKMQVLLSVLFGIFGVPFFIFSYVQWYYDYVTTGQSKNFVPVTVFTLVPTFIILLVTLYLYRKWQKEIFE